AEAHTRNAELAEETAGATINRVTATHADGRCVAGKLLQADACGLTGLVGTCRVDECLLQLKAAGGVALDDDLALLVLCNLALLCHVLALLAEFDVLADHGVVLLEHDAVGVVATVLAR